MKKRFSLKRLLKYVIFILIITAAYLGLNIFFKSQSNISYTPPLSPISTIKPQKGKIEKSISISSYVEASNMIAIVPLVNGNIETYDIIEGQSVEKDQVIATLDKSIYYQQYLQANSQYTALESAYIRASELNKVGATSKQELESLQAQKDAAKAQRELASLQLSYCTIKSPITGTVISAPSAVGSIASNSSPLLIVADLNNLIVNLSIPEKYYTNIVENKDALSFVVSRKIDDKSSSATLLSISPYIDGSTKTFKLKLRLDNPTLFIPGMFVKVDIVYQVKDDIFTLEQSIRKSDGSLYIVEGDRAKYLYFTPEIENDYLFEVPKEYQDALFINEGQNSILDGERVRIKESD